MQQEEKVRLINHLVGSYESGEKAARLDIGYSVLNKTFSMEIDGRQYSLTANQLADLPDGVGDEMSDKIKLWVK